MYNSILNEYRCSCGKLLLKGAFFDGTLEIKCKRCGKLTAIGAIKLHDDSSHYIVIVNDQGYITNVSDSACLILGFSSSELIGKSFTYINPTMPASIGERIYGQASSLTPDNFFQIDTSHRCKDGTILPVSVLLRLYAPRPKEKYVLASVSVKKKKSKKSSRQSDLRFVDNACDFYLDIDKEATTEYISPSFKKIFGYAPDKMIGKNYFDFTPIKTFVHGMATFTHFSSRELPYKITSECQLNIKRKCICCDLFFTPRFDDGGIYCGYRILGWIIPKPPRTS